MAKLTGMIADENFPKIEIICRDFSGILILTLFRLFNVEIFEKTILLDECTAAHNGHGNKNKTMTT